MIEGDTLGIGPSALFFSLPFAAAVRLDGWVEVEWEVDARGGEPVWERDAERARVEEACSIATGAEVALGGSCDCVSGTSGLGGSNSA